jgi:glutaredoxin
MTGYYRNLKPNGIRCQKIDTQICLGGNVTLDSQDQLIIQKWHETLVGEIMLTLLVTEDSRSEAFALFCDQLSGLASQVHITKKKSDSAQKPAIQVDPNIRYHAIPGGKELPPFLEMLTLLDTQSDAGGSFNKAVKEVTVPAELELFIASGCGFCPRVVRQVTPLAIANEMIRLAVIDASLFHEKSQSDGIRSVPTVVLDGEYRWTAAVQPEDIIEMLVNRDPAHLSASALRNIIEEGNAARVAGLMLDRGLIFPSFFDLLAHEKWPVRLGAIVALETVIEKDSDIAAQVVDPLLERFPLVDDQVKGDILYILGETGDQNTTSQLENVFKNSSNPELQETAREAVMKIWQRRQSM